MTKKNIPLTYAETSVTFPIETYDTGSTVDVESAAAQKVLAVAATTNFAQDDRVIIDRGEDNEEEGVIDTIDSGVSITLVDVLANTHASAVVVEVIMRDTSTVLRKKRHSDMLIIMPTSWEAADMTFLISSSADGTFSKLVLADDEAEVTIKASASEAIAMNGEIKEALEACQFIKLRSGTSTTPIDQKTDKTIVVMLSN